jgi:hypothetical protein
MSLVRLAILVAAVALPLFAASPAQALRSEFYGIGDGSIDEQDRQGMENANVHSERFLLKWRDMEPTRNNYDWEVKDHFIGGLAAHGIRPVPFVWGSPTWVNPSLAQPPTATTSNQQEWQQFLRDAVRRYGPGGTYWSTDFRQQFPGATPLPITTWQIWNEPNLKKFFSPGTTVQASAQKYATLLRLSDAAIASVDPSAMILLAGMPGQGDSTAWVFLSNIYKVQNVKNWFDGAAMHPYSCTVTQVGNEMKQFRNVMVANGDSATPIWVTEFAWGSGPEDQFCKNYGLTGQRDRLTQSFKLFLTNRKAWNLQRLFWFLWRDPPPGSPAYRLCSICGTAGLLRYNRTAKPALAAFKSFTMDSTPPVATISLGPAAGGFTNDRTPTFTFSSNEIGSTFICHYDANPFGTCNSPNTRATPLTDGVHTFYVKAVDAVGNESPIKSRSFTVDTVPPNTTITSGVANNGVTADHTPTFGYASSQAGSTFQCRFDAKPFVTCSGPGNTHTPAGALTSGGHSFEVKAKDKAGNVDPTPAKRTFTVAP